MSPRVPPSSNPPQSQHAERARRSTRPQASDDQPRAIKLQPGEEQALSPEAQLWAGQDMDRSLEIRAADVEQRLAEIVQSEQAEKEEGAEHGAELSDKAAKEEKKGGLFKVFSWNKPGAPKKSAAFKQPGPTSSSSPNLTGVSASRLQAVGKTLLSGQSATQERPPDAFALLREARDQGTLFVEDALAEGHSEDQEDPEHAAAVEECIARCFGVRGILRIGPGHNDQHEPIIVVATTHGFSEASLAKVPEKVHRFPTLIAIPFDLLPLKRER